MSKYDPLKAILVGRAGETVPMTFAEIEAAIGLPLPRSKRYPAWWSNNPGNNPMTQVWLDAGFATEQVDIEGQKLVFRRVAVADAGVHEEAAPFQGPGLLARLQGALGGTVRFAPGFEANNPTDEVWDAEH